MPAFEFLKKSETKKTFRVASVMGKFDLESSDIIEYFKGEINLPEKWSIGLIVGKSGSGKSSISKELFPDIYFDSFKYGNNSILDDMPENCSVEEITKTFSSVGFSSPPSWLKPYAVLSNGEKMRCDLARCILGENKTILFDEFTSVVDRQVAKIGSYAIQKAIRKTDKQFIAVTCHYDVQEWLLPDWIFNTDTMTFHLVGEEQKKNRPKLNLRIFRTERKYEYWRIFSRYHYLSHSHNNAARTYIAEIDGQICGFCSVLHFPNSGKRKIRKVHRLVVLPDYQGLGIGNIILEQVGEIFIKEGFVFSITTSSPNLVNSLKNAKNWKCIRFGRSHPHRGQMKGSNSSNRITASYEFLGI